MTVHTNRRILIKYCRDMILGLADCSVVSLFPAVFYRFQYKHRPLLLPLPLSLPFPFLVSQTVASSNPRTLSEYIIDGEGHKQRQLCLHHDFVTMAYRFVRIDPCHFQPIHICSSCAVFGVSDQLAHNATHPRHLPPFSVDHNQMQVYRMSACMLHHTSSRS